MSAGCLDAFRFEVQLQYGSIGWSVGATLGFALGRPTTRMLSLIGDGSFQVTAQACSLYPSYLKSIAKVWPVLLFAALHRPTLPCPALLCSYPPPKRPALT